MKRVFAAAMFLGFVLSVLPASDFAGAAGKADKERIPAKENEMMMKDEETMKMLVALSLFYILQNIRLCSSGAFPDLFRYIVLALPYILLYF